MHINQKKSTQEPWMKQLWPAALMVQVVQQATQHAGKTKKDQQKKTGTSTLAGQAAPGDGEILDQAIVPLPSEQAVTFGSEDVAPGTTKNNNITIIIIIKRHLGHLLQQPVQMGLSQRRLQAQRRSLQP